MRNFDVIIIGVGSMGSSACYYLAKEGIKVLALEQFDSPHIHGSHTGQSRIIRKAYFEDPGYVPLLMRAYENWEHLEALVGEKVYYRTGLAYFGPPSSEMIKGVKRAADLYSIDLQKLEAAELQKRFPQFSIPGSFEGLYEHDAGFIRPENAIRSYKKLAASHGAEIHSNEKVISWGQEGQTIHVSTEMQNYSCQKLVITAGAWAGKLIPSLVSKLAITRQFMAWVQPKSPGDFSIGRFPCWMIDDDEQPGAYYGFPWLPKQLFGEPGGMKLAHHYPGEPTNPDKVSRAVQTKDIANLSYAIKKYFTEHELSFSASGTCLYANSPDENFIIDHLPGSDGKVIVACGFSGHGFKFVSVVGEILAELTLKPKTPQPIGFLSIQRFNS